MTHADEVHFLAAIDAARDDMSPRLVYADWLEERGDYLRAAAWRWLGSGDVSIELPNLVWLYKPSDSVRRVEYAPDGQPFCESHNKFIQILWERCRNRRGESGWLNALLDAADAYISWRQEELAKENV